ncbi:MAG: hypothetical protein LC754_18180, partial [Acidobacteria bacterium]|nr:hypothetical protein [Acidobacteriota bacterium]
ARAGVQLFRPAAAFRLRKSQSRDTPLPPETPAGTNPPAGAIIDYALNQTPTGELTLEILDGKGKLVRRFSSEDPVRKVEDVQSFPTYWLRPPAPPTKRAGLNRFVWDLRYPKPNALRYNYSIAAVYGEDTPSEPEGPFVLPGTYQLKLTVAGRTYTAPLEVKLDPRVAVAPGALEQQLDLEMKVGGALAESYDASRQIEDARRQLKELQARVANNPEGKTILDAAAVLDQKLAALANASAQSATTGVPAINDSLASLMTLINASDTAPTRQALAAFKEDREALDNQLAAWATIKSRDLASFNTMLRQRRLPVINILDVKILY